MGNKRPFQKLNIRWAMGMPVIIIQMDKGVTPTSPTTTVVSQNFMRHINTQLWVPFNNGLVFTM